MLKGKIKKSLSPEALLKLVETKNKEVQLRA